MAPQFIDIRSKFKQFLLPETCLLCGADAQQVSLCAACMAELPWHDGPQCPVCALPLASHAVCGLCLKHPPAFDATRALFTYRFPVNALLQRYKYAGLLAVAPMLGTMLSIRMDPLPRPDLLLPMPLHPERLKERGFNQAVEMSRVLARRLDIPMKTQLVRRHRATPPQANLSLQERRRNLRGAFACEERLDGKHVVLVDDVMTTGASLNALALAVKNAGAARVECWVAARTLAKE